jgi:phosphoserine phosphatase
MTDTIYSAIGQTTVVYSIAETLPMELIVETGHRTPVHGTEAQHTRAYATVVLDVDLGISRIEGLAWLAARRGDLVAHKVAALAPRLRAGDTHAYAECLSVIRPRRDDVDALARAYVDALAPDCIDAIARLRRSGVRVVVVSRGLRHAMYRLAYRLAIDLDDVHAVDIRFDALGAYIGFDYTSPLTGADGRRALLASLDVEQPVLVVGDGPGERTITSFDELVSTVLR